MVKKHANKYTPEIKRWVCLSEAQSSLSCKVQLIYWNPRKCPESVEIMDKPGGPLWSAAEAVGKVVTMQWERRDGPARWQRVVTKMPPKTFVTGAWDLMEWLPHCSCSGDNLKFRIFPSLLVLLIGTNGINLPNRNTAGNKIPTRGLKHTPYYLKIWKTKIWL